MKSLKIISVITLSIAASGCQSGRNHNTASSPQPPHVPTYTVELIPNPQLTPTSREGDKSGYVYFSNIVAVYANTNGASASLINSPGPASRGARGQGH